MIRALKPTKVKRLLLRQAKEDLIYPTQVKSCRNIRPHVWILEPEASRRVKEFALPEAEPPTEDWVVSVAEVAQSLHCPRCEDHDRPSMLPDHGAFDFERRLVVLLIERNTDKMMRSMWAFCQGDSGAVTNSSIPLTKPASE